MDKLVVIGNGIAGHYALINAMKINPTLDLTIIYRENARTYLRTQLSGRATGAVNDSTFFMTDENFYQSRGIHEIKGEADWIDTANHLVVLQDGRKVPYDNLCIATGSYNFIPPVETAGHATTALDSFNYMAFDSIYTLRELKDANAVMEKLKTAKSAIIVGGGLLGLEAAGDFMERGIAVTVVEFAPRLLPRQLDSKSAEIFLHKAEQTGIKILLSESIKTIVFEDGHLKEAVLNSGKTLAADFILFSVGVRPNTELAVKSGLQVNRGIVADRYMRTSDPSVYTAGDCAEYEGMVYGNWSFAMASGKIAGLNCSGISEPMKSYTLQTMFNALGVKVFSTGAVNFDDPALDSVAFGDPSTAYGKLFFKSGCLTAAVLMGNTSNQGKIIKGIEAAMTKAEAEALFVPPDQPLISPGETTPS